MATPAAPTGATAPTSTASHYVCKWGRIEILTGDNYPRFKNSCLVALASIHAIKLVNGEEPKPAPPASIDRITAWEEKAAKAIQIISNSVDDRLQDKILPLVLSEDVKGIWNELKKYDKTVDPVWVSIQRTNFGQEKFETSKGIREFADRLESYKLQLATTERPITDDEILDRIIAAIPENSNYEGTKYHILRLPKAERTLDKAVTMLQVHDKRETSATANYTRGEGQQRGRGQPRGGRQARNRGRRTDRGSRNNNNNRYRGKKRGNRGGFGLSASRPARSKDRRDDDSDNGEPVDYNELDPNQCGWCMRYGHHEIECRTKRRSRKADRRQDQKNSEQAKTATAEPTTRASMVTVGKTQWSPFSSVYFIVSMALSLVIMVLTRLLFKNKTERHTERLHMSSVYYSRWMKAYTGRGQSSLSPFSPTRALIGRAQALPPALDSGASKHFSGVQSDFTHLKRWQTPNKVVTADGTAVDAIGYQDQVWITSQGELRLREVWYVPSFEAVRLISIPQLMEDGISVIFKRGRAIGITNDGNGEVIFTVPKNSRDNLFMLDQCQNVSNTVAYPANIAPDAPTRTRSSTELSEAVDPEETLWELMHRRLGHINYNALRKLVDVTDMKMPRFRPYAGHETCEACAAGKIKETFRKKTDSRVTRKGRRLHGDISGKLPKSYRGNQYFLLITDDATRCSWIRLLKDKSAREIQPHIREVCGIIKRDTGEDVAYFRCDNGSGEFGEDFQGWLKTLPSSPRHEPCPPYKHSLNGVIERAIQTMDNTARSMIYEAKLPLIFWDYAVEHAIWIKNRVPTDALPWPVPEPGSEDQGTCIPLEAYTGRKLDPLVLQKTLVAFGCQANIKELKDQPGKWTPRTKEEHIFVGITGNSVYKLLNCRTLKETLSVDVKFHEYKFPELFIPQEFKHIVANLPIANDTVYDHIVVDAPIDHSPGDEMIDSTETRADENDGAETSTCENGAETSPEPVVKQDPSAQSSDQAQEQYPPQISRVSGRTIKRTKNPYDSLAKARRTVNSELDNKEMPFSQTVKQLVKALNAVHLDEGKSSSLGVPSVPFEFLTVDEALKEDAPNWMKAIVAELEALQKTGTYEIITGRPPSGRKIISSKWVLKKRFNTRGKLTRRKARIVIRGFEQTYGIDYFETFASVMRYTTLRILLALAAEHDLEIDHIDIDSAFLNPPLEEEIYMEIPEFFHELHPELKGRDAYLLLKKSLYGLKQAPRAWLDEVKQYFEELKLTASEADPNLFIGEGVYILLFVDDMLIIGNKADTNAIKAKIRGRWKSKDLSPATVFVGFQIERDRENYTLTIHQEMYTNKLLLRLGLEHSNQTNLPFSQGTVLREGEEENWLSEDDLYLYKQIIGATIYLANCTRPDISYHVSQLARFMFNACLEHLRFAKQLLRYLSGTRTMGITYKGTSIKGYSIFFDSTWGTEDDRKSFLGWVVILRNGAVSWAAQRQRSTAQSSMEAEIMAANEAAKEAAWLEKLWPEIIKEPLKEPPTLYCDNLSAIDFSTNTKFSNKSKHIEVRYFYIRNDMVARNRLRVESVPGNDQVADILTKQLPYDRFTTHKATMGLNEDWFDTEKAVALLTDFKD